MERLFAFLVLCIHWFNPLVWLSFVLMSHDMEMSCDERVLKEMGMNIKKDYSNSLLALAANKNMINGSSLAFVESYIKNRIKNVLYYKKPAFWVIFISIILVTVMGIGLTANHQNDNRDLSSLDINKTASFASQQEQLLIRVHGSGGTIISGSEFGKFLEMSLSSWSKTGMSNYDESMADLTVYISNIYDHKIHFYKSEPEIAVIQFGEKFNCYKIPKDTYEKVYMMYALHNYIVPEDVIKAIVDGTRTNLRSVQDIPNNGDYQILKVGKENYFIYKKAPVFKKRSFHNLNNRIDALKSVY